MSSLQQIRKHAFWLFDSLKGSPIRSYLDYVKKQLQQPTAACNQNTRQKVLSRLLDHATNTTTFYRKYKGCRQLSDFPVIDKNVMRNRFEAFRSDSFAPKDCLVVSTSGSTGTPFCVLQDANKRSRNLADNLYFSRLAGYQIGNELHYAKIWPQTFNAYFLTQKWMQHIVPHNVLRIQEKDLALFWKRLQATNTPKSILAYASYLDQVCNYLDTQNQISRPLHLQSIIGFAEKMHPETQKRVTAHFGVAPRSRYSNNENGILAQQIHEDPRLPFLWNTASYFFEFLNKSGQAAAASSEGRIVVTDLFNYAMPLLRYDTGDIGTVQYDLQGNPYVQNISGRMLDQLFDTKGKQVPSHISHALSQFGNPKQFQLRQEGQKVYRVRLNTTHTVDENRIRNFYQNHFGQDALIHIEYVNEIPRLASGKVKEVVNTYYNQ